jgi:hypothetical protein
VACVIRATKEIAEPLQLTLGMGGKKEDPTLGARRRRLGRPGREPHGLHRPRRRRNPAEPKRRRASSLAMRATKNWTTRGARCDKARRPNGGLKGEKRTPAGETVRCPLPCYFRVVPRIARWEDRGGVSVGLTPSNQVTCVHSRCIVGAHRDARRRPCLRPLRVPPGLFDGAVPTTSGARWAHSIRHPGPCAHGLQFVRPAPPAAISRPFRWRGAQSVDCVCIFDAELDHSGARRQSAR